MTKAALQGLPTVVNNEYSSKERCNKSIDESLVV